MGRRKQSSQKQSVFSYIILFLFLSVFFVVGLSFLFFMAILPIWNSYQSASWSSTVAVIEEADIDVQHGEDSVTYKPKLRYKYSVKGLPYSGERLSFRTVNYNSEEELQRLMEPYRIGAEVECFYDPMAPGQSVLLKEAKVGWLTILLPSIFMAVPFFFGWIIWISRTKQSYPKPKSTVSRPTVAQAMIANRSPEQSDALDPRIGSNVAANTSTPFHSACCPSETPEALEDKPHVMKSNSSRFGAFFLVLFIAAFWNGIVGAILYSIISEKQWEIFPLLFLIPFELIGLVILGAAGYYFLKIFNPKPTVVCSNTLLYPGSEFELSWTFSGKSGSVQTVTLNLIGVETVTYRQGTSTRTETNEFFKEQLIKSNEHGEINEGFVLAKLPVATMHTFIASKNKIQWFAEIIGEIKRWPDVHEKFELTIYPPKVTN